MNYPKFIYKYRPIENYNDLKSDYYLDALFNQYAVFSSRTNFNDLFDSKIDLVKPNPKDIKELSKLLPKTKRQELLKHLNKGDFTIEGHEFISKLNLKFNERIDSYAFMSLSSIPDSNLMWSHYAASHRGFCIEYKTEHVKARRVSYVDDIPSLELLDLYKTFYDLSTDNNLGIRILDALHCKLDEWEYESEYRFMASEGLATINGGEKFKKVNYDTDFVSSIIFGYRMEDKVKRLIIEEMPVGTIFKQATTGRNTMKIVDYNPINPV
ncbi:TPA: DUF2971 domain-containing protein [Serratia marcescens]|uniref:DUF2971 domain-containing protein n=1 Tax=Serratia marcescens TaxID=615 RepID=UPI0002AF2FA5|nr:DUF2971 domain-containing protein [Serratia marcescens]AGE16275.1 hypothetical protein SMWW4_v1c04680 [Serratia marcescens WW4]HEI9794474.1 DUF2971 domain-containing protein [Serratia marcescens]